MSPVLKVHIFGYKANISIIITIRENVCILTRVSVQGVVSHGSHFATLCQEFDFYEVKKPYYYFSKRKGKYFYIFNHNYSEKSSKRANSTNHLL